MASDPGFVEYVMDQFEADCAVTSKKMFGECGLFSAGRMFGMICDDRLFVKPTPGGRPDSPPQLAWPTLSAGSGFVSRKT